MIIDIALLILGTWFSSAMAMMLHHEVHIAFSKEQHYIDQIYDEG